MAKDTKTENQKHSSKEQRSVVKDHSSRGISESFESYSVNQKLKPISSGSDMPPVKVAKPPKSKE